MRWEELQVGEEYGPIVYTVTDELIRSYVEATEDAHPWYLDGSPFGGRIAPPTLTAGDGPVLLISTKGYSSGLLARQDAEFFAPVKLGDTISVRGRLAEKYTKRGRRYIAFEYEGTDQRGERVFHQRITQTVDD